MVFCEMAVDCCVCNVAVCPRDVLEDRYLRGEIEFDEISHEYYDPEDEYES